jgi:protein-S-isoprenylcysteine O-methyltransferase Ste14
MAGDPVVVPSSPPTASAGRISLRDRGSATLVPAIVAAPHHVQYQFDSSRTDLVWEIASVLMALIGLAARVYTVGVTAPRISDPARAGEQLRPLNTTGPYSIVRHPLYGANVIIALGFSLFPHVWVLPPLVFTLATVYYARKAQRSETGLRERFGSVFGRWAARVPPIIPRVSGYVRADRPFHAKAALRQEHARVAAILIAPVFIDFLEGLWETHRAVVDPLWTVVAVLGLALFALLRTRPLVLSA